MSTALLLRDLTTRGVRLAAKGDRLRIEAPAGVLTPADRAALAAHKHDLVELLARDAWAADLERTGVPGSPCQACRSPLSWVEDWPTAGDGRWLCATCAAWPPKTLAETWATLTASARQQLHHDADHGDDLARRILVEVERA